MLHLLLGSPRINPAGEQDSGPTFWDKDSICFSSFLETSSQTGHAPGQAFNLVLAPKLQPRPRVYKIRGVVWRSGLQYITFFILDDVLTVGLFMDL